MADSLPSERKRCFVIGPFDEEGTDVRRDFDEMVDAVIRPVMVKLGYEVTSSLDDYLPEPIPSRVINHLFDDELVVADLSGLNPDVLYELAVRHAAELHTIEVAEQGTKPPW